MVKSSTFRALFLPGLPSQKKQYDILTDIESAGGEVSWMTYSGTYDRKSESRFTLESCVADIQNHLGKMENSDAPYIVLAYSFSTTILRLIDFAQYQNCAGVLLYSPIMNLRYHSKDGDFHSLIDYLQSEGIIHKTNAWDLDETNDGQPLQTWLQNMNSYNIPTFMFVGGEDETGLKQQGIQRITENIANKGSRARFIHIPSAKHHIDSYSSTIAKWYLWGLIAKIILHASLPSHCKYYLWGSTLHDIVWSEHSDIDILIIGQLASVHYEIIANIAQRIESLSGIHIGISINSPDDLQRHQYIRRNRGAVFLRELKHTAIPLGKEARLRSVLDSEVVTDALNTNRIQRAEVAKLLLKYYADNPVTKRIVKSYIQAVRLAEYARTGGGDIALYSSALERDDDIGVLFRRCIAMKDTNYQNVTFNDLYVISNSMNRIVKEQERSL